MVGERWPSLERSGPWPDQPVDQLTPVRLTAEHMAGLQSDSAARSDAMRVSEAGASSPSSCAYPAASAINLSADAACDFLLLSVFPCCRVLSLVNILRI